jgi:Domain of unknown function (DUF397)
MEIHPGRGLPTRRIRGLAQKGKNRKMDLKDASWIKSSHSTSNGECVEIAIVVEQIAQPL